MFGAEGVGWRGLGRDAAPAVVVAAAATATLWGALPAAKNPGHPHTAQAGGAEGASPSPGAGRPGVGGWRDRGPFGGLKGGNTSARVCWGARFQPLRGLAFFVAEPRTEDGSCWGEPSSPSEALLARDRGGWPGPPGYPSVWSPRAWLFPPRKEGLGRPLRIPFPLAPRTGARPHLSAAWGARGEESWHCSHKTDVM